ncbi:MAG TPA: flagellar basal body P-ring formation chaperone FlgA [Sphingobium sp.]|uniref:flagellar basal body P-ring formation chaperone FlgA n=1 Tax=Sphingobium sp. TaxID=1912891 RepID=UPI002ED3A9BC
MSAALSGAGVAAPASADRLPVLTRVVEKGEILSTADFETIAAPTGTGRTGLAVREAVGKETARRLRQGSAVLPGDLVMPRIVRRGEVVTINFSSGPLLITATGRALADAGKGEPLRVISLSTNRTLDVVADTPGNVVMGR